MLDLKLFQEILSIDSTSGHEEELMAWLLRHSRACLSRHSRACLSRHSRACPWNLQSDKDYLLLSTGTPRIVFCTHIDTVPPYIPPTFHREDGTPCKRDDAAIIRGRGTCDAKGQLLAMLTACELLAAEGCSDFGLLLLTGEETGSWGAKAFAKTDFKAPFLIVGEPTGNKMVSASKGTKAYQLTFRGKAFHSGYPQYGRSAVDAFVGFYNALKAVDFGLDPVLGETTWNIGRLVSDNPQNILSPELTCRVYFRTTFVSDEKVQRWMEKIPEQVRNDSCGDRNDSEESRCGSEESRSNSEERWCGSIVVGGYGAANADDKTDMTVEVIGGDAPARYVTLPGFESAPVAFGSDAPHLTNFTHKIICGPGSIRHAHRDDEHILICDLEKAVEQYIRMYHTLSVYSRDQQSTIDQ